MSQKQIAKAGCTFFVIFWAISQNFDFPLFSGLCASPCYFCSPGADLARCHWRLLPGNNDIIAHNLSYIVIMTMIVIIRHTPSCCQPNPALIPAHISPNMIAALYYISVAVDRLFLTVIHHPPGAHDVYEAADWYGICNTYLLYRYVCINHSPSSSVCPSYGRL